MEIQNKVEIILSPNELEEIAFGVAEVINNLYDNKTLEVEHEVVFCPILQGAVPFFADICKGLLMEPYVEYIGVSSYKGKEQQKEFNVYKVPVHDVIKGRTVWLFDDIVDSGRTLDFFTKLLLSMGAKEVKTCVLLKKKSCTFPVDVYGYELDDDMWVWGYGMDAPNGRGRTANVLMGERK
jgi:hypoxanthine phosphoribosyltransferase